MRILSFFLNFYLSIQGIVKCTPLIHNGFIYFGSYDKLCYKLNTSGELIWKIKPRNLIKLIDILINQIFILRFNLLTLIMVESMFKIFYFKILFLPLLLIDFFNSKKISLIFKMFKVNTSILMTN